jgi:cob(I)alamin adenosyltransferase
VKIYTRKGDDGTTGLLFGGRVSKADIQPEAYGAVDEAVAALGVARSIADEPFSETILRTQRELFVVGADLATGVENRSKLEDGVSRVTTNMVEALEAAIDELAAATGTPTEFIVPGGSPLAAALDAARAIVRRAERKSLPAAAGDSAVVPYLNRLADYLYMLARSAEEQWVPSRAKEDE